jgi:YD repeat-containing protein
VSHRCDVGDVRRLLTPCALALSVSFGLAYAATTHYFYDDIGRLVGAIDPSGVTTIYTYDPAGNLLSVSRRSSSEPSIVSFTPDFGVAGSDVTIHGGGFVPDAAQNAVSFGGVSASVKAASFNSMVATVPAGALSGVIAVDNRNGSTHSSAIFTVVTAPAITAVSPDLVPGNSTTRIDISGTGLRHASGVAFSQEGIAAAVVPGATDRSLPIRLSVSGTVPAGAYSFAVTNIAGTTDSGAVTVKIGLALSGPAASAASALSVFMPHAKQLAPAGQGAVIAAPMSVYMPVVQERGPAGSSVAVGASMSVYMPVVQDRGPAGPSVAVGAPVSVYMP